MSIPRGTLERLTNSITVCIAHNLPHKTFPALSRQQSQLRCRLLGIRVGSISSSSTLHPYHSPLKPHIRRITKYLRGLTTVLSLQQQLTPDHSFLPDTFSSPDFQHTMPSWLSSNCTDGSFLVRLAVLPDTSLRPWPFSHFYLQLLSG